MTRQTIKKTTPTVLPPPRTPQTAELQEIKQQSKEWGAAFREHLSKLEALSPEDLRARAS